MAFSLSSERPVVAAHSTGIAAIVRNWFAKTAEANARRIALATLLEYEDFRLDDLGISRQDIMDALKNQRRNAGQHLAFKRSVRAHL